jgi:hypothetical protein
MKKDWQQGRAHSPRVTKLVIAVILLGVLAPAIYFYWIFHASDGELAEKPVWAMLQGLAMDDSTNGQAGPLLHNGNGYIALGVPGRGAGIDDRASGPSSTRMWIVLNEHSGSRTLRQMNRFAAYDLRCAYVNGLAARVPHVDDYVLTYLRTICS